MARRRPTDTIITDRAVKRELITNCSQPEVLEGILRGANQLAFTPKTERAEAVRLLTAFCKRQGCILWTPDHKEHSRHLRVRIQFVGEAVISVPRVLWAVFHVVPEQGAQLTADEEIIHSCGNIAARNTGWNACLNPAHMIKMDATTRMKVSHARRLMQQAGMMGENNQCHG